MLYLHDKQNRSASRCAYSHFYHPVTTRALKRVLCASTYENVSTSVNPYSTKDETAARIARLVLRRDVQSHGDASLSLALGNESERTLETRLGLCPVKLLEQNCQCVK